MFPNEYVTDLCRCNLYFYHQTPNFIKALPRTRNSYTNLHNRIQAVKNISGYTFLSCSLQSSCVCFPLLVVFLLFFICQNFIFKMANIVLHPFRSIFTICRKTNGITQLEKITASAYQVSYYFV